MSSDLPQAGGIGGVKVCLFVFFWRREVEKEFMGRLFLVREERGRGAKEVLEGGRERERRVKVWMGGREVGFREKERERGRRGVKSW